MLQASNISVFRNDLSGLPLIFRENQQRRVHFSDYSTVTAVFANKENGVFLLFPLFKDDKETCETPFADLFKKKKDFPLQLLYLMCLCAGSYFNHPRFFSWPLSSTKTLTGKNFTL